MRRMNLATIGLGLIITVFIQASWLNESGQDQRAKEYHAGQKLLTDLKAAIDSGAKAFRIPKAIYRLDTNLELRGLNDFVLDGQGATLVFEPGGGKVILRECRNCSVKGLVLDLDPLPFTQGTILSVDSAAKTAEIRIDTGYSAGDKKAKVKEYRCAFFDPSGERELEVLDTSTPLPVEVSPGIYRISSPRISEPMSRNIKPGDRVALSMPSGGGGFQLSGCGGIKVEDVTVYAAGGFAFIENGFAEGGHTYERCRVVRRPGSGRLMAGASDGFHSITQHKGPTLRDCEISHCFDDLVNIHGFVSLAMEQTEKGAWIIAGPGGQDFSKGSVVRFFRSPNAEPLGEAKITECQPYPALTSTKIENRIKEHLKKEYKGLRMRNFFDAQPCRVRFDREVRLTPFDFVSCPDFGGTGAVIEDCYFHDGHVRGILIKSAGSVVARCRFERLARSGLVIAPEIYWLEGPFPKDIRILENTFTDCGFGSVARHEKHWEFAPLMVVSAFTERLFPPLFSNALNMERIECIGNRIIRAPGPGILIMNATEVKLEKNNIIAPGSKSECAETLDLTRNIPSGVVLTDAERDAMQKPYFGIFLMSVSKVSGTGNRVEGGRGLVGKGWSVVDADLH